MSVLIASDGLVFAVTSKASRKPPVLLLDSGNSSILSSNERLSVQAKSASTARRARWFLMSFPMLWFAGQQQRVKLWGRSRHDSDSVPQ
ncbi:hypothetical protein KCU61_g15, partial [Aureobasidium melanogenum]